MSALDGVLDDHVGEQKRTNDKNPADDAKDQRETLKFRFTLSKLGSELLASRLRNAHLVLLVDKYCED